MPQSLHIQYKHGHSQQKRLLDVEVLEAKLPKAEIVRDVAETFVGHRANGYVVPETTVPAAARSLR
jgi:hypothetical protein